MTMSCRLILRNLLGSAAVALALAPPVAAQVPTMNFVMESFPPFIVDDQAQGTGPFPDIVRAVCESMKIECTFKLLPWRRAYAMAEAGKVDGIFVLARTAEREKLFHYTDAVLQSSFVVFTRDAAFAYAKPQDLDGYTVATYGPSAVSQEMVHLSKSLPSLRLEMEVDNRIVLRKLRAGRYVEPAVAVMNGDVGQQIIAEEKLTGLRVAGEYKPVAYAIGLSRKKVGKEQADRFNAALRELIKQGTVKSIAEKYGLKAARQ
jgi:polar amino acid transport system substrate-binding protein